MNDVWARDTGRLAIAVGCVAAASALSLGVYFVAGGGPFGAINDIGNGATGILGGWLAWRLRHRVGGHVRALGIAAAIAGGALTVVGSALVISGTTGFLYAGLVSSLGFAGLGTWLLILNRSEGAADWPRGLRSAGMAAGALMAIGFSVLPAIPMGLDDMGTAPGWVWIGFLSWLGTYVALPAWAVWLGSHESAFVGRAGSAPSASAATD